MINDASTNCPESKDENKQKAHKFHNIRDENETIVNVHKIAVANALFLSNDFQIRSAYKTAAQSTYHSEVENLNFAEDPNEAKNTINT